MDSTTDSLNVSILPPEETHKNSWGNWFAQIRKRWNTLLYPVFPKQDNQIATPQSEQSEILTETLGESLRKKVYDIKACDLHDILREKGKVEWSDWHLLIHKHDKTLEITEKFHQTFKNMKESTSIVDCVDIIKEIYMQFKINDESWKSLGTALEYARIHNDPEYVIRAYTCHKEFTRRLNAHSAANTYHFIKLYCTILNCPTLHLTKDYVDAFTSILFHPKLEKYRVEKKNVYRGTILPNIKPIENYKVGATILTTTFLSTSKNPRVREAFTGNGGDNQVSVLCTYKINNSQRCSALDIQTLSQFDDEEEVLILRYVPFTIKSIETLDDGKIDILFEECLKEVSESNQSESNYCESIQMCDIEAEPRMVRINDAQDELTQSCCRHEGIHMNTISRRACEPETDRN